METTMTDNATHERLSAIAFQADIAILRLPHESAERFAERLVDAIAEKIISLNDLIDDVYDLELDDGEDVA
jgi:hypothetical protein